MCITFEADVLPFAIAVKPQHKDVTPLGLPLQVLAHMGLPQGHTREKKAAAIPVPVPVPVTQAVTKSPKATARETVITAVTGTGNDD